MDRAGARVRDGTPAGQASIVSPVEASQRIIGFDVVRALAAIGVIWVHAGRSPFWNDHNLSPAGSWGTAFLNTLAGFFVVFALQRRADRGVIAFAGHRIWRIYGAFTVWSLLYFASRVVNFWIFHKRTMLKVDWNLLFFGTTYHLWFLPYLLVVTLLTLPIVAWALGSRRRMAGTSVLLVVTAAAVLILPEPEMLRRGGREALPLFHLYARSPGFLFGLAIGLWMLAGFRPRVEIRHAVACAAIVAGAMYLSLTTELPKHVLNRLAATAAFMVALAPWRGPISQWLASMGKLGFGVYLCHVLFLEAFITALSQAGVAPSFGVDVAAFVFTIVTSFWFAWLMRQTKWLAWLIP
jgi:peptidoglycan/LPS O-acetylase OafA/YrhL